MVSTAVGKRWDDAQMGRSLLEPNLMSSPLPGPLGSSGNLKYETDTLAVVVARRGQAF
jgi:hypothetical protein